MKIEMDKIRGMFAGVFLGDLLGSSVEGWTADQISNVHGRITGLLPDARTTDDWQLTKVVAEALIKAGGIDMDVLAAAHVEAYRQSHARWGPTTLDAVRKLISGKHWSESGLLGTGNGVVMKLAPVATHYATLVDPKARAKALRAIVDFTQMTHRNRLSVQASLSHVAAVQYCLKNVPSSFKAKRFIDAIIAHSELGLELAPPDGSVVFENLTPRLRLLYGFRKFNTARIIDEFRGTSCVLNSLPFTYVLFLRNPFSFEPMLDIVNCGGDTDTNCSMAGALLGALNGVAVFPKEKLICTALNVADRFTTRVCREKR